MKLRALNLKATGNTIHWSGEGVGGEPQPIQSTRISHVEIVADDFGYFLMRYDQDGICLADTWHESLDLALEQARFEFQLEKSDWEELSE